MFTIPNFNEICPALQTLLLVCVGLRTDGGTSIQHAGFRCFRNAPKS